MDSLQQYGSDTDDSEENPDTPTTSDKLDTGAPRGHMFGLIPSETTVERSRLTVKETEKVGTLKVENETVNVSLPGSSFWNNTELTDLQILENTNKITSKRTKRSDLRGTDETFKKCRRNERGLNKAESKVGSMVKESLRKLYFVHPKIGPHLHKKPVNKLPSGCLWTNSAHAGATNRVKWNVPNFSHLLVSCSMDSTIKVWNVWSDLDPCVQVLRCHTKAVKDVQWSEAGNQLLSASYDKTAVVSNVETGSVVHRFEHPSFVMCAKYHLVDPQICVTGCHSRIMVWDCRSSARPVKTFTYKDNFGQVQDLVFSPDCSQLFSCSDLVSRDSADRNLMAWDFQSGVTISNQIYQERYLLTRLQVHRTERQLLAQSQGNYIALFSLEKPYRMVKHKRYDAHKVQGYSVGFDISPDGQTVYSGSSDGKLYCYNYANSRLVRALPCDLDIVLDVACHPVLPSTVAASAWDGTLQVWK